MIEGAQRGECNNNARLTEADVRTIRELAADGWSQRQLGRKFRTTHVNVGHIIRRETWDHVR